MHYDVTATMTLHALWRYRHYDVTCTMTLHPLWRYMHYDVTCTMTLRALWSYVHYDVTCTMTLHVLWRYVHYDVICTMTLYPTMTSRVLWRYVCVGVTYARMWIIVNSWYSSIMQKCVIERSPRRKWHMKYIILQNIARVVGIREGKGVSCISSHHYAIDKKSVFMSFYK